MIETYNNIARYNLIETKYHQMAFQSPSDGALISPYQQSFGTPGQTKVSSDRQRETTHEICCLAAECALKVKVARVIEFFTAVQTSCRNNITMLGILNGVARALVLFQYQG